VKEVKEEIATKGGGAAHPVICIRQRSTKWRRRSTRSWRRFPKYALEGGYEMGLEDRQEHVRRSS
jgi:hypothetical protein